ncbi:hypothetical protein [Desulfosediminicola flagellatus]|uniref:hypothetical protein n=1 Tax=Desulfosediminicola flagellatus TaxID=2569541 RepID=UPI0010ABA386|nr:hypothetical protein [Desulfosediminicola flagellatus]
MKNIIGCLVRSIPIAAALISIGYFIVFFILKNTHQLDFTLFVLGAIPIVIFLPSVFSQSKSGALHTPKVIFRKVETLKSKEKHENENIFPALSYVLAGVIIWIFSSLIY